MQRTFGNWIFEAGALLLIFSVTVALYSPFLNNALVFDDHNIFGEIYDYALTPLRLAPRAFPYFTLGFVEVVWKSIEIHRTISLSIHLLNVLMVYRLIHRLSGNQETQLTPNHILCALSGALFFAIHPVAVYGAAYLAQRTMLFATLFSLLSIWFYLRSLSRNSVSDAIAAAIFYSLAVFSKEHAIMLPLAVALLSLQYKPYSKQALFKASIFLFSCIPAAVFVILAVKGVVGTAYEPESASFIESMPATRSSSSPQLISLTTQCGLFFQYLWLWLVPDIRTISADIRIDIGTNIFNYLMLFKLMAYLTFGTVGWIFLKVGGRLWPIGWGMLYFWMLFATELVTVRFQEPFVLYRSYLWACGLVIGVFAAFNFSKVPKPAIFVTLILAGAILFHQSYDRLKSLENDYSLWHDAAEKLASPSLPGAERIFYNRAIQRMRNKQSEDALADMSTVVSLIPEAFEGYFGRAKIYAHLGKNELALADLDTAQEIASDARQSLVEYEKFWVLSSLARLDEAKAALGRAAALGHPTAQQLIILESKGQLSKIIQGRTGTAPPEHTN